ncbi:MAG: NUDIX domain-containing protein [Thermodesulfobacteriota bacterium]
MEEILEWVDENNRVMGTMGRRAIHFKGLRHRSVHVLVFNSKGDLYLQKRSPAKDQYPEHWDTSAAGHTDPGESPLEAAQRELQEELGLEAELTKVLEYPACPETGWEFVTLFSARSEDPVRLNLEEALEGRYFNAGQVARLLSNPREKIAPGFRLLYELYRNKR